MPVLDSAIQAEPNMISTPRRSLDTAAATRCTEEEAAIVWLRWTDQPPFRIDHATYGLFDDQGSRYEVHRIFRDHDFFGLAIYRGYARVPQRLTLRLRLTSPARHIDLDYPIPVSVLPPAMPRRMLVPHTDPSVVMRGSATGELTFEVKPSGPEIKTVMVQLDDTSFYPEPAFRYPLSQRSDGMFTGTLLATGSGWADAAKIDILEAVGHTEKAKLRFGSANLTPASVRQNHTFERPELVSGPFGVSFELAALMSSGSRRARGLASGTLTCVIVDDFDPAAGPPPMVTLKVVSPKPQDLGLERIGCVLAAGKSGRAERKPASSKSGAGTLVIEATVTGPKIIRRRQVVVPVIRDE